MNPWNIIGWAIIGAVALFIYTILSMAYGF